MLHTIINIILFSRYVLAFYLVIERIYLVKSIWSFITGFLEFSLLLPITSSIPESTDIVNQSRAQPQVVQEIAKVRVCVLFSFWHNMVKLLPVSNRLFNKLIGELLIKITCVRLLLVCRTDLVHYVSRQSAMYSLPTTFVYFRGFAISKWSKMIKFWEKGAHGSWAIRIKK